MFISFFSLISVSFLYLSISFFLYFDPYFFLLFLSSFFLYLYSYPFLSVFVYFCLSISIPIYFYLYYYALHKDPQWVWEPVIQTNLADPLWLSRRRSKEQKLTHWHTPARTHTHCLGGDVKSKSWHWHTLARTQSYCFGDGARNKTWHWHTRTRTVLEVGQGRKPDTRTPLHALPRTHLLLSWFVSVGAASPGLPFCPVVGAVNHHSRQEGIVDVGISLKISAKLKAKNVIFHVDGVFIWQHQVTGRDIQRYRRRWERQRMGGNRYINKTSLDSINI